MRLSTYFDALPNVLTIVLRHIDEEAEQTKFIFFYLSTTIINTHCTWLKFVSNIKNSPINFYNFDLLPFIIQILQNNLKYF